MGLTEGRGPRTIWKDPAEIIRTLAPERPVMGFDAALLRAKAAHFLNGFPGLVTYAVKANPDQRVIRTLVRAGIRGFDVASPFEIDLIARLAPGAALHYHNPIRSRAEIAHGIEAGVRSWSVDCLSELEKLFDLLPAASEIAVRFKLPVRGAAYDFGAKFGATPEKAAELLGLVARRGHVGSLSFHPGTQCTTPSAWQRYIQVAAEICAMAGVRAHRLNVGGGFPSRRSLAGIDLDAIFAAIRETAAQSFGPSAPGLVCEPGRALCADAFSLITRVKAMRDGAQVFLNDGIYGCLAELAQIGNLERIDVLSPEGVARHGPPLPRLVFGPTCDSLDRLPGEIALPDSLREGDFIVFHGAGAYSTAMNTRFNGFGQATHLSVRLDPRQGGSEAPFSMLGLGNGIS